MSNTSTQVVLTFGVSVTLHEDGRVELFQCGEYEDSASNIIIGEDEARILVMRLGRRLGMSVTYSEDEDHEA